MAFDRRRQETKQPYEEWPIDINFGFNGGSFTMPPGATKIVAAEASATKWQRRVPDVKSDATSEILRSPTPIILAPSKTKLRVQIFGGDHDYDYQITVRAEFDNGSKLEEEFYIRVRED